MQAKSLQGLFQRAMKLEESIPGKEEEHLHAAREEYMHIDDVVKEGLITIQDDEDYQGLRLMLKHYGTNFKGLICISGSCQEENDRLWQRVAVLVDGMTGVELANVGPDVPGGQGQGQGQGAEEEGEEEEEDF